MAKTIERDEKNWLLLRKRKDWKKFLVKRLPDWRYITIKK